MQYSTEIQQNAATTGTAMRAGKPYLCARMSPAMASATQRPDDQTTSAVNAGLPGGRSEGVKLLILALALVGTVPTAASQMPEGLVRAVAAKGSTLVEERNHYTYTQLFRFQEIHRRGRTGLYEELRDITFTESGERIERHRKPPISRLNRMRLTEEDFRDLREVNPFVLTLDTLWFYSVRYKGVEPVEGEECHTLRVQPRQILDGQRFFDGLVWVSVETGNVVRVAGQPVPQMHGFEESNLFPFFVTTYKPIDGKHWFPVRTESDDILPFPSGNQRVKVLVEYTNYKRFSASSTVTFDNESLDSSPSDR